MTYTEIGRMFDICNVSAQSLVARHLSAGALRKRFGESCSPHVRPNRLNGQAPRARGSAMRAPPRDRRPAQTRARPVNRSTYL
jgi:hypothetical protein